MAAYAALVSLKHTIEQIQHHPRPPISLDGEQVESLSQIVSFLQEFLESYSHLEAADDGLESRIADAAYVAEDSIESYVVDQIHEKTMNPVDFYECLRKITEDVHSIKKDVMEMMEKEQMGGILNQQLRRKNSLIFSPRSSRSSSWVQVPNIVGFDDLIMKTLDKLIGGRTCLQIIRVVGMGGIGKSTLARTIYENQMVVDYFDIRAWVTVSQDYRMSDLLLQLLEKEDEGSLSEIDEDELALRLYKRLSGRRYLIIIDDIWDDQVWNDLKFYFPNSEGSRIIFTTRLSNLASSEANSHSIEMHFLDKHHSWNLFCNVVFGNDDCPQGLNEIGRKIAESCKGLPLSINVIGGLLAKSTQTQRHWEYVAENFDSIVNLEDGEYCLQVLAMSYSSLPIYLKPCFLYMGFFGEKTIINASKLIKFWAAEGFLKPHPGRSQDEVAEKYLEELIDRNLIIVVKRNYHGRLISFRIHNLLRNLCLREARKERFFYVVGVHSLSIPQDLQCERRICIQERGNNNNVDVVEIFDALRSSAYARSLIWEHEEPHLPGVFRLLRVYAADTNIGTHLLQVVLRSVNLRYVNARMNYHDSYSSLHSSFSLLWNLQTLIVSCRSGFSMPSEIWKMPRLRHVEIWEAVELPDPPTNAVVLEDLEELSHIKNFKCSDEVVMRIPSIKKLRVSYGGEKFAKGSPDCCLHNLGRLHKLESFGLRSYYVPRDAASSLLVGLCFPHSLKKLTLEYTFLPWGDMKEKIGPLPLLQVLKLKYDSFVGAVWETVEGQFPSLKFLVIERCHDLEWWMTDKTHFPRLEHLLLRGLLQLREIPPRIGEIPTLTLIQLVDCSDSSVHSAKKIRDEQVEEYGNVELQVRIPSEEEDD